MHNGSSELRARTMKPPRNREIVAPKPRNAVIPPPYWGTDSETNTVTIEPGYGGTILMHMGPNPGELQGPVPCGTRALRMANRRGKKRDPPHPNR